MSACVVIVACLVVATMWFSNKCPVHHSACVLVVLLPLQVLEAPEQTEVCSSLDLRPREGSQLH